MFKRILVAVDDSATSALALRRALQIAALRGSGMRVVHVLEHPISLGGYPYGSHGQHYLELARRQARELLAQARRSASEASIDAETRLLDGAGQRLGETVAEEARAWNADLVVVGSHGRSGISRAVLGSGAEQVLRLAPAPVLVVHGPQEAGAAAGNERQLPASPMFKRILVPVDGSETSTKALVAALQLARDAGGRIRVLHSLDDLPHLSGENFSFDAIRLAREQAQKIVQDALAVANASGVPSDSRLLESVAPRLGDVVADEARAWEADLVVVGTHGRRGVGRALLGSGAEQVIRVAPVPVLAIRGSEAAADA